MNGRIISTRDEDITGYRHSSWLNKDYIKKTSDWGDDEQLNFYLNYSNTFNDVHRLDAVLLTEWYEGYNSQVYGGRETFPVYLYDPVTLDKIRMAEVMLLKERAVCRM